MLQTRYYEQIEKYLPCSLPNFANYLSIQTRSTILKTKTILNKTLLSQIKIFIAHIYYLFFFAYFTVACAFAGTLGFHCNFRVDIMQQWGSWVKRLQLWEAVAVHRRFYYTNITKHTLLPPVVDLIKQYTLLVGQEIF